jgi:hypothetical protein
MSEKLDRILEYCDLVIQVGSGAVMESAAVARLERLRGQLSAPVPSLDERDPYTLLAQPLAAEVVVGSTVVTAELRNASATGIALAMDGLPPGLGERVTVTARDVQRGIEYAFTGTVMSRVVKGGYAMSLAFAVAPAKVRLGGRSGVFPRGGASEAPTPITKRSSER